MQKVKWQNLFLRTYIIRFKNLPIPWVFTVSRSCKINCKLNIILVQIPIVDFFNVTNPVVFKLCPIPPLFQENLFQLWPLIQAWSIAVKTELSVPCSPADQREPDWCSSDLGFSDVSLYIRCDQAPPPECFCAFTRM